VFPAKPNLSLSPRRENGKLLARAMSQ